MGCTDEFESDVASKSHNDGSLTHALTVRSRGTGAPRGGDIRKEDHHEAGDGREEGSNCGLAGTETLRELAEWSAGVRRAPIPDSACTEEREDGRQGKRQAWPGGFELVCRSLAKLVDFGTGAATEHLFRDVLRLVFFFGI
ncbi:MAG: hypothetical protein CMP83_06655 [Gammaproteobacteria bacterium]|nr:hypothetical protein [Gammaproteobacteria bacterium]